MAAISTIGVRLRAMTAPSWKGGEGTFQRVAEGWQLDKSFDSSH
jgi:hypothetical protein